MKLTAVFFPSSRNLLNSLSADLIIFYYFNLIWIALILNCFDFCILSFWCFSVIFFLYLCIFGSWDVNLLYDKK